MYKHEISTPYLFYYHLILIQRVKSVPVQTDNLSNFPTQNIFWSQALHILIWVSPDPWGHV